jgi:hypothetical protein
VIRRGEEVASTATSRAAIVEQAPELFRIRAGGLAVHGGNEILVGDRLEVEGEEAARRHGTDGTSRV